MKALIVIAAATLMCSCNKRVKVYKPPIDIVGTCDTPHSIETGSGSSFVGVGSIHSQSPKLKNTIK